MQRPLLQVNSFSEHDVRDKTVVSQEGGVPAVQVCRVRGAILVPAQAPAPQEARLLRRGHGGQHQVRRYVDT